MTRIVTVLLSLLLATSVSGMPKVVLIPNQPLQEQLKQPNVRYVLKRPIDLHGAKLIIPSGSTLEFKCKGLLSNGTLKGDETTLKRPKVKDIRFDGTFVNTSVTLDDAFAAESDFWNLVRCFYKADIVLAKDITLPETPVKDMIAARFHLNGKGHTVAVQSCPILRGADVCIKDVVFDCTHAKEYVIYAMGVKSENRFVAQNCYFFNVPEAVSLCARAYSGALVDDCTLFGNLSKEGRRTEQFSTQILLYSCKGDITVRNNSVKNCFGGAIKGIGFCADENSHVIIENNTIDNVTNGGIVFAGGEVWNVTVKGNHISRTHALGKEFDGELDGAINSAINFHGFRNILIENNEIDNCPLSSSLDFDGSIAGKTQIEKGTGLTVRNNRITNSGPIALFVVRDVDFVDNMINNGECNKSNDVISVWGSDNVIIHNNRLFLSKGSTKSFYPIYLVDSKYVKSGVVQIKDNEISTDGEHFVFVNASYSGDCQIGENTVRGSGRRDGTLTVVNNSKQTVNLPKTSKLVRYK